MIPRLFLILLATLAAPALAAERSVSIGSFDRVRVDAPFEVRIATGRSPRALLSGDADAIEAVEVRVDGSTLVVRARHDGWDERPRARPTQPMLVTLTTPTLSSAVVVGGARVAIGRMKAERVSLSVTGTGSIAVTAADAGQLNAQLIGTGTISVGGRATRARLSTNGPGTIDAALLEADDLTVWLEGPGETRARARYAAQVTSTGLGSVTVAGPAKCTVKAVAGDRVSCGTAR